jgi:8-oxo-dGTP pyrophosphatase MutT (NUDIX family)
MNENAFCNNCGKAGHPFHQCKLPITSIGIIAFRNNPEKKEPEFLMIRRKDTLGYMDFMRGKFPIYQKNYILNMMTQMTMEEKTRLRQKYREYHDSSQGTGGTVQTGIKEKIHALIVGIHHPDGSCYDLLSLLDESDIISEQWHEPEWGFPKGRRNVQENDYDCALREFSEETGYAISVLQNIRNILPFEEIFIGSNYKSYRHKYYIMHIPYEASISSTKSYQKSEVSGMEWKSYAQCLKDIRSYNLEKKRILRNVYECIAANKMVSIPISNGAFLADI